MTVWEWLGYLVGINKDADMPALHAVNKKLGGNRDYMTRVVIPEEKKDE